MKQVIEIFEQLKSDTSKSGKERIIKQNLDNPLFVECMRFLLDPFVLTGISSKKIVRKIQESPSHEITSISDMFNYLKENNTGSDKVLANIHTFTNKQPTEYQEFLRGMICKDIKLGVDSLWNKTVPESMKIGEFNVMLAKKASEHMDKIKGNFVLTKKLDGSRIILVKENGKVKTFTRTGQEYIGLNQIEEEFERCSLDNMVWDGELLADVKGTTSEIFTETLKKSRTKDKDKTGLKFHVFDMLPLNEFKNGKSKKGAIQRKIDLHDFFFNSLMIHSTEVAPLYVGDDLEQITVWSNWANEQGWEGIMVNIDAPYECKRTSNLLKVKEMQSCDLLVVSVEEGEGKYKGMMGKCVVEYKGGLVGVGSGWSDDERKYYYNNPDELIGRVIEVQFFEESIDSKTKQVSLRFPIFKCVRELGKEVSYN